MTVRRRVALGWALRAVSCADGKLDDGRVIVGCTLGGDDGDGTQPTGEDLLGPSGANGASCEESSLECCHADPTPKRGSLVNPT
jgi:hypothetical protein